MKILALITARGGSKRIPGKNIRLLGGRPLIVWSIDAVKGIPSICDILVSTDDHTIAEVARNAGALVPWLRPIELSSDTASSVEVCLHALDWYQREKGCVNGILLLQPTSPFRSRDSILRGMKLFRQHKYRPVIGISPVESHPLWCYKIEGETMRPFINGGGAELRSQDLPPAYVVNGAFYLATPADLLKQKSFYNDDVVPLVIENPDERIDIDTEWEWRIAEAIVMLHDKLQNDA